MADNNGKVIPFPKSKKEVETKEPTAQPKSRRKVQGAVVSGMLVAFAVINVIVTSPKKEVDQGRGIASVRDIADQAWQKELASDLSKKPLRGLAMTGTRPQLLDELQFGELKGQYSVNFEGGKIKGVHLTDPTSEPVKLSEPEKFLRKYQGIWPYQFQRAEAGPVRTEGAKKLQSWKLYDKGLAFAEVEFVFGAADQFEQLTFKKEHQ